MTEDALRRDVDRHDRLISGIRESISGVERRLVELEIPMKWITRLLGIIAVGVLGLLGTQLASAMGMHVR